MEPRQNQSDAHGVSNLARTLSALFLLAVGYWFVLNTLIKTGDSADLRALWLAGQFFAEGVPELIYTMSDGLFTMEPPEAWITKTLEEGREMPVYPFIYPPLWAWVASHISSWVEYDTFIAVAAVMNRGLVPLSFLLAWKISKSGMSLPRYMAVALVMVTLLLAFTISLRNNQMQIPVTFLILLAIERQRAGWNILGGAALALAASIKLYPVLFALLWLAAGHRKAVLAVFGFGGLLGLTSLAVAPWSMHAAMLHEYSSISDSFLLTRANFSFGPLYAALTVPDGGMQYITTYATGGTIDWYVGSKTIFARSLELALTATTLCSLILLAKVTRMREPLLWPAAAFAISWVSPLSWVYHYTAMLVFVPVIIERYRGRGGILIVLCTLPISVPARNLVGQAVTDVQWIVASNIGLIVLGLTFFALAMPKASRRKASQEIVAGE